MKAVKLRTIKRRGDLPGYVPLCAPALYGIRGQVGLRTPAPFLRGRYLADNPFRKGSVQ